MQIKIMNNRIILLSCLLFSSCAFSTNIDFNSNESVNLGEHLVSLDSDSCSIELSGVIKTLDIEGKCVFIKKDQTSEVKTYHFDDIESEVAIVIGNNIINDPEYPITSKRSDCGDVLVGITVNKSGDIKLKTSENSSIYCAGTGAEEPLYWVLSHD